LYRIALVRMRRRNPARADVCSAASIDASRKVLTGSLFGSRINPRMPLPGFADRRSRLDARGDDARAAAGQLLGRQTEVRHLAGAVVSDEHVRAGVRYARFALSASPTSEALQK
jgi:hypothetical protein